MTRNTISWLVCIKSTRDSSNRGARAGTLIYLRNGVGLAMTQREISDPFASSKLSEREFGDA